MDTHENSQCGELSEPRRPFGERRREMRDPIVGSLYLIDNVESEIVRCRCVDASQHGMRLRLPVGYGVRAGRRYELCSHRPGQSQPPGLGLLVSRRATVTRTKIIVGDHGDELEIGVQLDPNRDARVSFSAVPLREPVAYV